MTVSALHAPTLRSYVVTQGLIPASLQSWLESRSRSQILDVLSKGLIHGRLSIQEDDVTLEFGSLTPKSNSQVVLIVRNPKMWSRIAMSFDLGVSEAYIEGDFEVSSLKELLNLWLDNQSTLSEMPTSFSTLFSHYSALAINKLGRQTLNMARKNVELAYDTSNTFFECFLSQEMMYSCAIWEDAGKDGVYGDIEYGPQPGDLEAAQMRKVHNLLKKSRLRPGDRLLEFGSGWGAMSIQAALLGCTVDTVTLSVEQKAMTEQRAREAGVGDQVRVHLCDYRALPRSFEHAFDAFISSEMIEAVGPRHLSEFFRILDWALKPDRATIVITATTQPEHRWSEYQPDDFARHYHWPNTHLPSATSLAVSVQTAVPGKFTLHHLEDHGIHYPRTLREWGRRLEKNFHGRVLEELRAKHPQLSTEEDLQAFKRKWLYMFVYAEVGYARAYTSLNCWTFARPENVSTLCA